MKTNQQAQDILELLHQLSGDLLKARLRSGCAFRDGKIETGELLSILLNLAPSILAHMGVQRTVGN